MEKAERLAEKKLSKKRKMREARGKDDLVNSASGRQQRTFPPQGAIR